VGAGLYKAQGQHVKAEHLYERALAIREKALGFEHPDVAQSLNNLADALLHARRMREGRNLCTRRRWRSGKRYWAQSTPMWPIASTTWLCFTTTKAESLYLRSVTISEKALEPNHLDVAMSLQNLGFLYCNQGHYAIAQPFYERALTILENALGSQRGREAQQLSWAAPRY
jgi:tetratricopeptide (TPR) repeat protein